MVSGQALSPEIHKIVIRLSRSAIFTRDEIAAYTGVSISSVHNILNYFDKYQTIKTSEDKEKKKRKKRAGDLRDVDIQVCCHVDHFILALIAVLVSYEAEDALPQRRA
jgi:DNA-directed RNA polymerase specialized sigma subunit